ncbi:uncharacterized protein [Hyperolius riggenbachi]|uniref:uncharacterized protein isoform X2 n=1 Tax=Hyperolius riggenbachi TaxID=752182 RepID=UPI0035A30921
MDTLYSKGGTTANSYLFPGIKEEEDMDSYTDMSGQGHLVYSPDTLLWIKRVDEAELTTDDDSEAKEPQANVLVSEVSLKAASASALTGTEVRRRPRFTASEEFVLVREMLEHYDKLFGERARITPFAQKVLIWQKVLDNVNSVGVVQRGIEEAKKHWHLYRHKLMEKLSLIQKHGAAPSHPLFLQLSPLENKVADLFKLEYMLRRPQYALESQDSAELSGHTWKDRDNVCEQRVESVGQGDYFHSKASRNIKFSFDENCALVHEAVGVWDSIIGKNAANTSQARKNYLWSRIVEAVNAAGTQPRSAENCKKRLRDIKRRVKAKMADQRKCFQRNGGGPGLELQYLSYEEELMHVIVPDTVRPVDGHVDTDRAPRLLNPPAAALLGLSSHSSNGQKREGKCELDDTCDEDDFWNHSSFDMAEEEDEKETIVKMEPIDYSIDAIPPHEQPFPVVVQPVPVTSQLSVPSQYSSSSAMPIIDTAKPSYVPAKHPAIVTKPILPCTKSLPNKPVSFPAKPPIAAHQLPAAVSVPGYQPSTANVGTINKVMGTFHSAQHSYHQSQKHQMHVLHMDLLHVGTNLQQLTRNIKVNNHVRATARSREFRLKQKDLEDQRQYRMEKLRLLRKHHEAKLKLLQKHFEKKETLLQENNQILQSVLQRMSSSADPLQASSSMAAPGGDEPHFAASLSQCDGPSLPQNLVKTLSSKSSRTRGGKGKELT